MKISLMPVKQWLPEWDEINLDAKRGRSTPKSRFYMFTMNARQVRSLCGIYRRTVQRESSRHRQFGIQRRHDEKRSQEIAGYVRHGEPWPELSDAKRETGQFDDLLKAGWLPTAIVVNILQPDNVQRGERVAKDDVVSIRAPLTYHPSMDVSDRSTRAGWKPKSLPPIELIDREHRLWAFADERVAT